MVFVSTFSIFGCGNQNPEEGKDWPQVIQQIRARSEARTQAPRPGPSATMCPLPSGVLSNIPVPRGLSQPASGSTPQVKIFPLWLQHPQVLRANLSLFISCVTVVNLAANTWLVNSYKDSERDKEFALCG